MAVMVRFTTDEKTASASSLGIVDGPVASAIAQLQARGEDLTPALTEIGEDALAVTQRSFETKRSPSGIAWPPRVDVIQRSMEMRKAGASEQAIKEFVASHSPNILLRTRRLFDSINYRVDAGTPAVEWGSNVIYARVHQLGAEIKPRYAKALVFTTLFGDLVVTKKVKIPARPYLGASDRDIDRWAEILGDYLAGLAPAGGGP